MFKNRTVQFIIIRIDLKDDPFDVLIFFDSWSRSGVEMLAICTPVHVKDAAEELGRIEEMNAARAELEKLNAEKPVALKPVPGRIVHIKIIIKSDPAWTLVHTGSSFDGWNQCCVLPLTASQSILRISSRHCSFAIHKPI